MVEEVRFQQLWQRTGGSNAHDVWLVVEDHYHEDHRAYHGWIHIGAMLRDLDSIRFAPDFAGVALDEVELAVFFHDVIYDPQATDNEARSAALYRDAATGMMPPDRIDRVVNMILATTHHDASDDPKTRLLLDLDLAILGSTANEYRRYCGAIRAEYEHVSQSDWRKGRAKVLEKFLARSAIYQTPHFHGLLEANAREHLNEELASLRG